MPTQETSHPDIADWEVDDDLQRAKIISRSRRPQHGGAPHFDLNQPRMDAAHEVKTTDSPNPGPNSSAASPISSLGVSTFRFDQPEETHGFSSRTAASLSASPASPDGKNQSAEEYPPSPQGGWRPWIFASAGIIGGNVAMTLGGVSPKYLPTIIIAEIILGVIVCVAFYPRRNTTPHPRREPG